jgi:hypothetical protein
MASDSTHDRIFGFGTNARNIANGGKRGYIGSQSKGKTEIPFYIGLGRGFGHLLMRSMIFILGSFADESSMCSTVCLSAVSR